MPNDSFLHHSDGMINCPRQLKQLFKEHSTPIFCKEGNQTKYSLTSLTTVCLLPSSLSFCLHTHTHSLMALRQVYYWQAHSVCFLYSLQNKVSVLVLQVTSVMQVPENEVQRFPPWFFETQSGHWQEDHSLKQVFVSSCLFGCRMMTQICFSADEEYAFVLK